MQRKIRTPTIADSCFRSIGERLTYLRMSAGLTISDAAKTSGFSRSELSRLENDKRRLKPKHALALANAYGLTLETLKTVLDYEPDTQMSRISVLEPAQQHHPQRSLSTLLLKWKEDGAIKTSSSRINIDIWMPLSTDAYCVQANEKAGQWLHQEGQIAVVDPALRTLIGDRVVHPGRLDFDLMIVSRDQWGQLVGVRTSEDIVYFGPEASVRDLHKVVAVFPAPYLLKAE